MMNLKKEIIENGIHYTLHGDYYTERVSSQLLDKRTGESIAFLGRDIRLMKNDGEKA